MSEMPSAPAVTVCMPASRPKPSFTTALRSVLEQDVQDLEVVICDDSGGSVRELAEAESDPRVRYFPNAERLGLAGNHMACMERAEGRMLAFLHDDDRFLPGYLRRALERFEAHPELGMVCSDALLEGDRPGPDRKRAPRPPAGINRNWLSTIIDSHYFIPSTTVMRREVWDGHTRRWPDVVVGDLTMYVEAARAGWPMEWIDEPLVVYAVHGDQVGADDRAHRDGMVQFWSSYRFDEDPQAEALRVRTLAGFLIARAGMHLKRQEVSEARADLRDARASAPGLQRPRVMILAALSHASGVVAPVHRTLERARNLAARVRYGAR